MQFISREVSYLGHIISAEGVRTDPRKVAAVKEWSQPRNVHELRSFLGSALIIEDTDASHANVGAVLSQEIDGQECVLAYWSKCLSKPERNYCVTRKELLAIVKAVENFRSYVYGRKFLLRTDHASLTWLLNSRTQRDRLLGGYRNSRSTNSTSDTAKDP
ncbi:retrovirus-related Pol polyprotein from transposon 412 [Trichonephila clavata]|uniref:Retrovirus-related Pol polyprotein from transposon 412 n=1 Tax=Trichonephila clavata TaxID=2740835 RepID=A0A8X6KYW8_TRICU|nr:retrovirus-related Pol polyprotein from transposon 412 [Trichonephila clavata]